MPLAIHLKDYQPGTEMEDKEIKIILVEEYSKEGAGMRRESGVKVPHRRRNEGLARSEGFLCRAVTTAELYKIR